MSNPDSVEDGDSSSNGFTSHCSDFTFAFNDRRYSDRDLIIEILADDETQPENGVEECSRVVKLHVSTILLAAKSAFFNKLFTNGMMESGQKCVTLRINATEETAFMELMNYMYGGTLASKSACALLDVLKLADRFQVVQCKRLCTSLLTKLPMNTESALLYLTYTIQIADGVQPLADKAKRFLQSQYKDIDCVRDEIMEMPLVGIEAILSSDTLQVFSEDKLFDLALKWVETHYPKPEDQQKIFSEHLGQHIRFHYMSLEKLREVLSCNIFYDDFVYKTVFDALFLKIKTPNHHHIMKATIEDSNYGPFVRRDYERKPIKLVEFDFPCQDLVVYFELPFDECTNLKPSEYIYSETFNFGGHALYLFAQCHMGPWGSLDFAVGMGVEIHHYAPVALDYDFAVRSKCTKKFVHKNSGLADFSGGCDQLLHEVSWHAFQAGEGLDFIDGILYLEVMLRIKQ